MFISLSDWKLPLQSCNLYSLLDWKKLKKNFELLDWSFCSDSPSDSRFWWATYEHAEGGNIISWDCALACFVKKEK